MPTFHFLSGNFGNTGIDAPVVEGSEFPSTSGISPFTLLRTSFIIFVLNCSEVTYLYVKKPPPKMPNISIPVTIVIMSKTFRMIKEQIARATALMSVVVLLLIVALSPLYVTMGLMTRQMQESNR